MKLTKQRLVQIIKEELEGTHEGHMDGMMRKVRKAATSEEPQMYAGEALTGEALIAKIIADEFDGDVAAFKAAEKAYMDKNYPLQMPEPVMDRSIAMDPLKK